jgi:SAM-dependent methyltransferase
VRLEDYSVEALKIASEGIAEAAAARGLSVECTTRKTNAFKLAVAYGKDDVPQAEQCFDIVYCAGLYDYLRDDVACAVTCALYHQLIPGGTLVITNVDPSNPNKWAQELLLNWPLIYRDRAQMRALAERLAERASSLHASGGTAKSFDGGFRGDITLSGATGNVTPSLRPGEFCITEDPTGVNLLLWIRANDPK